MFRRLLLVMLILLCCSLAVLADGCIFGRDISQLRETHQLAVIHLTESTADVSMFIAIEGITAGQQVTYILPFWYQPEGFSLAEDDALSFRHRCVEPAHELVKRMQWMSNHRGSTELFKVAPVIGAGPLALFFFATLGRSRSESAVLTPYATDATPHASAELYRIDNGDLQQLLTQSGLPEKYLQPLAKYHTPFFAVMHLKGFSIAEKSANKMSGRGIHYHFTHHITGGRYVYPLGTGAAWPQPIPITEVYITCPNDLRWPSKHPLKESRLGVIELTRPVNSSTI